MAKAKVLADRISITSDVLTDENIERVKLLAPSMLKLVEEFDDTVLYEVCTDECNGFNMNGAAFKDGKTLGYVDESILELDETARKNKINNLLTAILTKINAIESQVEAYLEDAIDMSNDIEYLD